MRNQQKVAVFLGFILLSGLIICLPAQRAHADTLNQETGFFTNPQYEAYASSRVMATSRLISEHANWYVSDAYWNSLSYTDQTRLISFLSLMATEFDLRIYPTETNLFGSEPNPGIDNDPRVTIVLLPLRDVIGGYFDTSNEYSQSQVPDSNEREVIFLNVPDVNYPTRTYSFLAHEFQHLITYNQKDVVQKVTDDIWTNEMRSEYAVSLLGYNNPFENSNLQHRIAAYIQNPFDSLTEWKNTGSDYGQIAIFGEYLAEQTSPAILTATARTASAGIVSIADTMREHGISTSFDSLFGNWLIASFLNNPSLGPAYAYTQNGFASIRLIPTFTISAPQDTASYTTLINAKDWEGHWIDVSSIGNGNNTTVRFSFTSPSLTSFHIPYALLHSNGQWTLGSYDPTAATPILDITDAGTDITRVVLMPFKHDKLFGFGENEPSILLQISISRVPASATVPMPSVLPPPTLSSLSGITHRPAPEDFGLHEGDFIRTEGDIDVYIINQYGYKRLVLNPQICLMYGHLGARGCFGAVKTVSSATRDAFITSWLVTNGETHDGNVWQIVATGDDSARIKDIGGKLWNLTSADPKSVFLINASEQNTYAR